MTSWSHVLLAALVLCSLAACGKQRTQSDGDAAPTAPASPSASLLADDDADRRIAEELRAQDTSGWMLELRRPRGQLGGGGRMTISGNGRVMTWSDPSGTGSPDDTAIVSKDRVLRLFAKLEKADLTSLPEKRPGPVGYDISPTELAWTRRGTTVSRSRTGAGEPVFRALVEIALEVGNIADVPRTAEDCALATPCKLAKRCTPAGTHCVGGGS